MQGPKDIFLKGSVVETAIRTPSRTIMQAAVDRFVEVTGELNWLHLDPGFCRTKPFARPIAYAWFGPSVTVGLKYWMPANISVPTWPESTTGGPTPSHRVEEI